MNSPKMLNNDLVVKTDAANIEHKPRKDPEMSSLASQRSPAATAQRAWLGTLR